MVCRSSSGLNAHPPKIAVLAATARIANSPSVLSNVLLGVLCGLAGSGFSAGPRWPVDCVLLILSGLSLYIAGNFLNDWHDRDWDARHRPERALPREMFKPSRYFAIAVIAGCGALFMAAMVHVSCLVVAAVLACCIVVYTRLHKSTPWAVLPMGMCRGLLPLLGFCGVSPPQNNDWFLPVSAWLCAAGLLLYIAALSLHARRESLRGQHGAASWLPTGLFMAAAAAMGSASTVGLSLPPVLCLAGLIPYAGWTFAFANRSGITIGERVSGFLAGIPWVDAMLLLPLGITLALGGNRHPAITALAILTPPTAVGLSRLLQRWTPAT